MFNIFSSNDETRTFIGAVMDESGSMSSLADDARGSYNTFLEEQRGADVDDEAFVSVFTFDEDVDTVYEQQPVDEAGELNDRNYSPGSRTALLDAVGECIDALEKQIEASDESVDNAVVFIMTDGKENASEEYSIEDVSSKISEYEDRQDVNWTFFFAGAGLDDFADAQAMNIDRDQQFDYAGDAQGIEDAGVAFTASVGSMRASGEYDREAVDHAVEQNRTDDSGDESDDESDDDSPFPVDRD